QPLPGGPRPRQVVGRDRPPDQPPTDPPAQQRGPHADEHRQAPAGADGGDLQQQQVQRLAGEPPEQPAQQPQPQAHTDTQQALAPGGVEQRVDQPDGPCHQQPEQPRRQRRPGQRRKARADARPLDDGPGEQGRPPARSRRVSTQRPETPRPLSLYAAGGPAPAPRAGPAPSAAHPKMLDFFTATWRVACDLLELTSRVKLPSPPARTRQDTCVRRPPPSSAWVASPSRVSPPGTLSVTCWPSSGPQT